MQKQAPMLSPTSTKILQSLARPQHFTTIFQTKTSNLTLKTIYAFLNALAKALYVALNEMRTSIYPPKTALNSRS